MKNEEKMIIYQVFTRLFGNIITTASITETSYKTVVEKWLISRSRHLVKSKN